MKKRHICAVFSLFTSCLVIFTLRNRCISSANEYWFGVWAMICCWLFHCWFVDGCFIADEYFFVSECFWRLCSEGWGSGLVGLIGWGDGWVLAEGVLTRACMRDPVLGVLFFCCHKCHSGWGWKCFIIPKTTCRFMESDVSFYRKQRVDLQKTSCHFIENIVSFCGKWRVVLDGGRKVVLRMVFWEVFGVE